MNEHLQVWERCLATIRESVNPQSFKTWFEPIRPIRLVSNALTIQVPNNFFYEWLEENYVGLLKKTIRKELGKDGKLEYQIVVDNHTQANYRPPQNGSRSRNTSQKGGFKNPFAIPGIKKVKVDPQLNPKYRFDNFIEGDCNKLARSAGLAISKNPGGTAFNPLFIYGEVGLGKTHLAHAIGNEVVQQFGNKSVLYVSTEKFTSQIIDSIRKNSIGDLVAFYQSIDVLLVDDIQFLSGKTKTQEIFFNIFNELHQMGKQIVLTSDRAPKSLEGIQDRLISRFKWGLSADLQRPDLETRMAILYAKIEAEGASIPLEVIEFIAHNVKKNVRELEGVLISLMAQATLTNKNIDLDLAKSVISKSVNTTTPEISVDNITELVAQHFNLDINMLQGKTRKREIVMARQLSMYLAKNMTSSSLKHIGKKFGGRDHSTVIYSCRTVKDLMDTDRIFKDTVKQLEKKVQMTMQ